jgi:hypothetical protein
MDEKQTRYVLDLLRRRFKVGEVSDDVWIENHVQRIYSLGKDEWRPSIALAYLERLDKKLSGAANESDNEDNQGYH